MTVHHCRLEYVFESLIDLHKKASRDRDYPAALTILMQSAQVAHELDRLASLNEDEQDHDHDHGHAPSSDDDGRPHQSPLGTVEFPWQGPGEVQPFSIGIRPDEPEVQEG